MTCVVSDYHRGHETPLPDKRSGAKELLDRTQWHFACLRSKVRVLQGLFACSPPEFANGSKKWLGDFLSMVGPGPQSAYFPDG